MTPENQRIALAKWAGWKNIREGKLIPGGMVGKLGDEVSRLPDFLHDLNAVYELEERLAYVTTHGTHEMPQKWYDVIVPLCKQAGGYGRATAAQRCEALLRTLGLWEDSAPTIQPGTHRKNAL